MSSGEQSDKYPIPEYDHQAELDFLFQIIEERFRDAEALQARNPDFQVFAIEIEGDATWRTITLTDMPNETIYRRNVLRIGLKILSSDSDNTEVEHLPNNPRARCKLWLDMANDEVDVVTVGSDTTPNNISIFGLDTAPEDERLVRLALVIDELTIIPTSTSERSSWVERFRTNQDPDS